MSVASAVRRMVEAGFTHEQALLAAEIAEEEIGQGAGQIRTARQDRNRRYYEKKASEKRLKASEQDVSDASRLNQDASDGSSRADILTSKTRDQVITPPAPKGASSPASKPKRRMQVPEGFWPSEVDRSWCVAECRTAGYRGDPQALIAAETPKFVDRARSRSETYSNPNLAWRNWMRNAVKWASQAPPARAGPGRSQSEIWSDVARGIGGGHGKRDQHEPEIIPPARQPRDGDARGHLHEPHRDDPWHDQRPRDFVGLRAVR